MAKRGGAKKRKSFFFRFLVALIVLGFTAFLFCAETSLTPLQAAKYLLGQIDMPGLADMPQLPELPHLAQIPGFGFLGAPEPSPSPSPGPAPTASTVFPSGDILQKSGMHAYILDVGQGCCIFLCSPGGYTMLVDTGESSAYPVLEAFLQEQAVTRLDVVVASHPHSDHIGSMPKIIRDFEIGAFYMPDKPHTTALYESMIAALEKKGVQVIAAYGGKDAEIPWDPLVKVSVLSPIKGVKYEDMNNLSVVLRIAYEDTSILLPGDAEAFAEETMLAKLPRSLFPSSVLYLGHHGSATSTTDAFLQAVNPSLAIASAGAGNDFGHPSGEVLEKLSRRGIPCFRTDENGTIHLLLNGRKVQAETER